MVKRISVALLCMACLLVACATDTAVSEPSTQQVLAAFSIVNGGWLGARADPFARPAAGARAERIVLRQPVGVAARGNDLFIADAGLRQIFRYDIVLDTIAPFAPLSSITSDNTVGLFVAADQSLYVAEPAARRVLHYGRNGELLHTLRDDASLGRPIAVTLDAAGQIYVADSLYNQIVAFNSLGRPLGVVANTSGAIKSFAAMVIERDTMFLVDRAGKQILTVALPPAFERSAPIALIKDERAALAAIAVDRDGRIFVVDNTDQTIKVYVGGKRIAAIGGEFGAPRFTWISAISIDDRTLYVADMLSARIHVFRITPEAMRPKGTE